MMQIINIEPHYERILTFLYPKYSVEKDMGKPVRFIVRKDLTTPNELRRAQENFDDGIVISSKLYNEYWDEEVLKTKALDFARTNYKCRKRTLTELSTEDPIAFLDSLIHFMYTGELDTIPEDEIMELFQSYGSVSFNDLFIRHCQKYPLKRVTASMFTFVSKINESSTSLFYKKKYQNLGAKIQRNLIEALDYYKRQGTQDEFTTLYFLQLLVK